MRTTRDAEVGFCNWLLVKNETLYLDTFCIRRLELLHHTNQNAPKTLSSRCLVTQLPVLMCFSKPQ